MQNTVYECKQNGEDFFSSLTVTYCYFGNRTANGLVTEQPQYSVIVCIFPTWQNTETSLISNDLRFVFTYLPFLALPILLHCFRHTFATLQLTNGTDIYTVSKMLGHTNVRTTQIYTKVVDAKKETAADAIKININLPE